MKQLIFLAFSLFFYFAGNAQKQTPAHKINSSLIPQPVEYYEKTDWEYEYKGEVIALDDYNENDPNGTYIEMKFQGKKASLKLQKQSTTKTKRVFSNNNYIVTFYDIIFGECAGEGTQTISGKLLIQTRTEQNTVKFTGRDILYSSKKCKEVGNG